MIDTEDASFLFYLFRLLRDAGPAYRALSERHASGVGAGEIAPEALAWARELAYAYTGTSALIEHPDEPLEERVPPEYHPAQAAGVLAQLAYAFCALTEEQVLEDAVLAPNELEGLLNAYAAGDWVEAMREWIEQSARDAGAEGTELPPIEPEPTPLLGPLPEGGMTPLRTFLLAEELPTGEDLPPLPDGPHEVTFPLYMRMLAMILLLAHHGELYSELPGRGQEEPGPELEATSIEAANDIALVLLWFGRHMELLLAARRTPQFDPTEAWGLLSELCFGFLLATSPREAQRELAPDPGEHLDARLRDPALTRFVAGLGYEATFVTDLRNELRKLRSDGASQPELLVHAIERVTRQTDDADAG